MLVNTANYYELGKFIEHQRAIARHCNLDSTDFGMWALITSTFSMSKDDEQNLKNYLGISK